MNASAPTPLPRPSLLRRALVGFLLVVAGTVLVLTRWKHPTPPPPEVRRSALELRDGSLYRLGETNAYAGWMVDFYPGELPLYRSQVSNGQLNGLSEGWYTNGVLQVREYFKDDVSHGLREKWYPNGRKMSEATIKEGKITGTFRRWSEAGDLAEEIQMKDGQPDGLSVSFYPSGFVRTQMRMKAGQLLEQKTYKEEEQKRMGAE